MGREKGGFLKDTERAIVGIVTERFIPIYVTTQRAEVERTCAAFEASSIPILVEHIAVSGPIDTRSTFPGYRIMTSQDAEQRARAIIGRTLLSAAAAA